MHAPTLARTLTPVMQLQCTFLAVLAQIWQGNALMLWHPPRLRVSRLSNSIIHKTPGWLLGWIVNETDRCQCKHWASDQVLSTVWIILLITGLITELTRVLYGSVLISWCCYEHLPGAAWTGICHFPVHLCMYLLCDECKRFACFSVTSRGFSYVFFLFFFSFFFFFLSFFLLLVLLVLYPCCCCYCCCCCCCCCTSSSFLYNHYRILG